MYFFFFINKKKNSYINSLIMNPSLESSCQENKCYRWKILGRSKTETIHRNTTDVLKYPFANSDF